MRHLFLSKKLALLAIEKGFNEPCLGALVSTIVTKDCFMVYNEALRPKDKSLLKSTVILPLYQQILDWFRDAHNLHIIVNPYGDNENWSICNLTRTDKMDRMERLDFDLRNKYLGIKFKTYYEAMDVALEEMLSRVKIVEGVNVVKELKK